jgi:protoheme IX farnesyltransferase
LRQLSPAAALGFSIAIGAAGVVLLAVVFNLLTAFLALGTILFYSLVYTLWLKPTTSQNIVIGGVAGAMAPVGAWTAATGSPALTSWLLFAIIFFWTPPHFWSLALKYREDYRHVSLPMLPVTHGVARTLDWIFAYTLVLFAVGLLPVLADFGWLYLAVVVSLGSILIRKVYDARKRRDIDTVWGVFRFSPIYLFGVFLALIADRLVGAL